MKNNTDLLYGFCVIKNLTVLLYFNNWFDGRKSNVTSQLYSIYSTITLLYNTDNKLEIIFEFVVAQISGYNIPQEVLDYSRSSLAKP